MKQHITKDELYEVSNESIDKLAEWAREKGYIGKDEQHIFLSIGQMIEFLEEKNGDREKNDFMITTSNTGWHICFGVNCKRKHEKKELVDVLWEAVKEVLLTGDVKSV